MLKNPPPPKKKKNLCAGLKTQIPMHSNSIGCPKIVSLCAPVMYWLLPLTHLELESEN